MLAETNSFDIIGWSLALLGLLVGGFWAAVFLKRRLQAPDEEMPVGFTLSDLRELHRSGRMTAQEYEKAKEQVVKKAKLAAERMGAKPKPQPPLETGLAPPLDPRQRRTARGFEVIPAPEPKPEDGRDRQRG